MYACVAETEKGARCRHLLEEQNLNGLCSHHRAIVDNGGTIVKARKPETVLVKFNINPRWVEKLTAVGVKEKSYDTQGKEDKHVAHAEQHGRQAYAVRKDVADSGVPVFGKDGLVEVSIYELLQELLSQYNVVDIHLRPRRDQGRIMMVLVISFQNSEQSEMNSDAFQELLSFLASSCWGHCHVWANPPQDDGRVINTVNAAHREQEKKAKRILRFADGLWSIEEK